jgi:hypothetical protein
MVHCMVAQSALWWEIWSTKLLFFLQCAKTRVVALLHVLLGICTRHPATWCEYLPRREYLGSTPLAAPIGMIPNEIILLQTAMHSRPCPCSWTKHVSRCTNNYMRSHNCIMHASAGWPCWNFRHHDARTHQVSAYLVRGYPDSADTCVQTDLNVFMLACACIFLLISWLSRTPGLLDISGSLQTGS